MQKQTPVNHHPISLGCTPEKKLLLTTDLCTHSSLSKSFFEKKRVHGGGPPFIKIGRCVRYPADDFFKWLEGYSLQYSTSDAGSA